MTIMLRFLTKQFILVLHIKTILLLSRDERKGIAFVRHTNAQPIFRDRPASACTASKKKNALALYVRTEYPSHCDTILFVNVKRTGIPVWCIRRNSSSSDEMGDTSSIPLYYSMHANIRKDGISAKPPLQSLNEKENGAA